MQYRPQTTERRCDTRSNRGLILLVTESLLTNVAKEVTELLSGYPLHRAANSPFFLQVGLPLGDKGGEISQFDDRNVLIYPFCVTLILLAVY